MKKPLPNDFYESETERLRNNGYWDKKYKYALERWKKWKEKQNLNSK